MSSIRTGVCHQHRLFIFQSSSLKQNWQLDERLAGMGIRWLFTDFVDFLYPPAIAVPVEDIVIAAVRHTFLFTLVNMDGF